MDVVFIPGHMAVIVPVLVANSVVALKAARFLFVAFKRFRDEAITVPGQTTPTGGAAFRQQRAYANAETVVEVRIMVMLALAGVLGILWALDVPTGKTPYRVESAYTATGQLFMHILWSSATLFFPEEVTKAMLNFSAPPLTAPKIAIWLILILDVCAHIANASFLAVSIRNRAAAFGTFVFSVLLYRLVDKGLRGLGHSIQVKIENELRELEQGNVTNVDGSSIAQDDADATGNEAAKQRRHNGKKGSSGGKHRSKGH